MDGKYASMLFGPEKPSVSVEVEVESGDYEPSETEIVLAAEIMAASKSGDAKRLAKAVRAAFLHYDAMPHEEGPHLMDD